MVLDARLCELDKGHALKTAHSWAKGNRAGLVYCTSSRGTENWLTETEMKLSLNSMDKQDHKERVQWGR